MATVRKREGTRGRAVWQAQVIRHGHRRQYRTFSTRGEAEAWAKRTESAMFTGEWTDRSEGDRLTLREALDRYQKEIVPHKGSATQKREIQRITYLQASVIAPVALSRLTGKELGAYARERESAGLGGNAIRRELAIISHLYTIAQGAWGLHYLVNPVALIRTALPPVPSGRDRRLQDNEEKRLLLAANDQFRPVVRFALATAMRRGEITGMRWEHVNLKLRTVHLPDTKSGSARTVPLSPAALTILRGLGPKKRGRIFDYQAGTLSQAMGEACKKAGIHGLTFHDLRHEAISRLFEQTDLDMMEIARISGHKTVQMLSRYTHLRAHLLADRLAGKRRTTRQGN